jgi:hypothetical protein
MWIRRIGLAILLGISLQSFAQREDFRSWFSFELEGEVFDLIDFGITPELRLEDNSRRLGELLNELELSVPVTKFLRIGTAYRYAAELDKEEGQVNVHRFMVYGKLQEDFGPFEIDYRAKYQREYSAMYSSELGELPETCHRHRIGVDFEKKGWDITPGFSAEMFFMLRPYRESEQNKLRLTAELQYKITKDLDIKLAYKYQKEFLENNPMTSHILCLGLQYEL